jgi:hypothetical protein
VVGERLIVACHCERDARLRKEPCASDVCKPFVELESQTSALIGEGAGKYVAPFVP